MEAQEGKEVLRALDAADGHELWKTVIDETFRDSQGPPAPRCTPIFADGRVYAQSCKGELVCVAARNGERIWAVNYVKDFGSVFTGEKGNAPGATRHGNNGTPWVANGWLWASAGSTNGAGVVALDATSGAVRWKGGNEIAAYAAPMIAVIGGTRQVVNFMADATVGLDADSGRVLWRHPMKTAFARHVMTPLVLGDRVIIGSHQTGLVGLQITRAGTEWKVAEAWVSKEAAPNFSCPVAVGDWVFGLGPQKDLVCVESATGKVKWSKTGWVTSPADKAHVGMINIGDRSILMLTDAGELVLFAAEGAECRELGRVQVCGANWCNPALVGTRLYLRDGIRNSGSWWCVDLKP
jgi:outer membrane protein assembly factor BamB